MSEKKSRSTIAEELREVAGLTPPICLLDIPHEIEVQGQKVTVYCKPFEQYQGLMREAAEAIAETESKWIPVEEDKPKDFVSVLGHMTDTKTVGGDFPSVRECYLIDGQHFFFPALGEVHPVDKWMNMPEVK